MKPKEKSQTSKILRYMLSGKSITPMGALKLFNCWALSSRVSEIQKTHKVKSELIERNGKRFSKYSIEI